jgi:hypothetical protein
VGRQGLTMIDNHDRRSQHRSRHVSVPNSCKAPAFQPPSTYDSAIYIRQGYPGRHHHTSHEHLRFAANGLVTLPLICRLSKPEALVPFQM